MKVLSYVVICCVVIICFDFVCSKSVTAIAKAKAGHGKNSSLLDQALADHFQWIIDDNHIQFKDGASDKKLSKIYDPIDVKIMMPDMPTMTDPMVAAASLRGLLASLPKGTETHGSMIEAYSYRFSGFRVANAICRTVGLDAAGKIIYIARASQIWRRVANKWRIHRENSGFECFMNCSTEEEN